jgi:DNA (cytosine-5)-methyltransferase 1
MIYNHISAKLSAIDMMMVRSVPEGGNWKDIPDSIPSQRLVQIRESFARGEGSRSTYYGRLRRDAPAYTINTYFNRPGNGCHVHYDQDRVISQREAARLQSFPDDFRFRGPQGSVNNQIGNAVPPLLAYQIARSLGEPGQFIDLFAGAGGLGLGFKWAGWEPLVANDIDPRYLETYAENVHETVVVGSITDPHVFSQLAAHGIAARKKSKLWVLGGPPCQGFSTAGQKRTMDDQRNHLAWDYVKLLEQVKPDGFVFENVTGILNMHGGAVFRSVKDAFAGVARRLDGCVLSAEEYGIPQRRKRVILVGKCRQADANICWDPPKRVTEWEKPTDLFESKRKAVSVEKAISDLPELLPAEDGTIKKYKHKPKTLYQQFMRGVISPEEYLQEIKR